MKDAVLNVSLKGKHLINGKNNNNKTEIKKRNPENSLQKWD